MKILNVLRFKRKLQRMPKVAKDELRSALEKSADEIVDLMRRAVPVDEGNLRASIGWTWGAPPEGAKVFTKAAGAAGLVITIFAGNRNTIVTNKRGIQFQNAFIQEFGTKTRRANPFFRPSFRFGRKRAIPRITRAATKAAKKVAAGE